MEKGNLTPNIQNAHVEIKEKIGSVDAAIEQLEEIEQLYRAEDWVEDKMGGGREALAELGKLLNALKEGLEAHWRLEGREMMPFLRDSGQDDFAATLLSEHLDISRRLKQFSNKAEELAQGKVSAQQLGTEMSELRRELKAFFGRIEEHATREEQMLFRIGHGG